MPDEQIVSVPVVVPQGNKPVSDLRVLPQGAAAPALQETPLPQNLLENAAKTRANSKAPNTRRAYESDWAAFERWCHDHGRRPLPASDETVSTYLDERADLRKPKTGDSVYAPSTISRWLSSINAQHKRAGYAAPGNSWHVQETMAGIRRDHVRPTRRMAPLLLVDLKKVLTALDIHSYPAGIIGQRDAALLVMGFAGAFRRSELASRRIGDVILHPEDGLHVRLLTSKTDQEGRGSVKPLPYGTNTLTCPPCAFLRWVRVLDAAENAPRSAMMRLLRESTIDAHTCRGPAPELDRLDPATPLFRPVLKGGHIGTAAISGDVVDSVVKRRLAAVGMNSKRFGGHSLRAGFVTQALRAGSTPQEIMRQTDHKNPATVEIYRREHDPLRQNAVATVGI